MTSIRQGKEVWGCNKYIKMSFAYKVILCSLSLTKMPYCLGQRLNNNIKEQGAEGVTLPVPTVEGEVVESQSISQNCHRWSIIQNPNPTDKILNIKYIY